MNDLRTSNGTSIGRKEPNFFYTLLVILEIVLFLCGFSGCSHTTKPKTASLSGTVLLINDTADDQNDPADFAGITVALYHPAEMDTTISRINIQYPNIGVQINQETEFDHRLQSPVKSTLTLADGSFNLTGVAPGNYNAVLFKEGWGLKYIYNLNISEGPNQLEDKRSKVIGKSKPGQLKGVAEMYPCRIISNQFTDSTVVFLADHDYKVTADINLTGNAVINANSRIWVDPGKSIYFYGNVSTPTDSFRFARFSSSDKMYSTEAADAQEIQKFYSIKFADGTTIAQNRISSIITTFLDQGWYIKTPGISISNMIFDHCSVSILCEQVDHIYLSDSNFSHSTNTNLGCVSMLASSFIYTSRIIVTGNKVGLKQNNCDTTSVTNSCFSGNSVYDIINIYETSGIVKNCSFENSQIGVYTTGRTTTDISYCNFYGKYGIFNDKQLNWFPSWFTASYNNFYCSSYAVKTKAFFYQELHLNAKNNYWGTNSATAIQGKIWDINDEDPQDPDYPLLMGIIDYSPYKTVRIQTAGITP